MFCSQFICSLNTSVIIKKLYIILRKKKIIKKLMNYLLKNGFIYKFETYNDTHFLVYLKYLNGKSSIIQSKYILKKKQGYKLSELKKIKRLKKSQVITHFFTTAQEGILTLDAAIKKNTGGIYVLSLS